MSRLGSLSGVVLRYSFRPPLVRSSRCLGCLPFSTLSHIKLRRQILSLHDECFWATRSQRRLLADYPDHLKVSLPALSPTMESGNIVSWAKKEGDKLNEGDLLAEIETDKATMGFETPEEGYLARILVPAGSKGVPVGKLVCIIVQNKEDVDKFKDFKDETSETSSKPASVPSPQATISSTPAQSAPVHRDLSPPKSSRDRVYASPMAKRLAEVKNLRLDSVKGTGMYGSITSRDIAGAPGLGKTAEKTTRPAQDTQFVDIPLTAMRTVIAKRLLESKTTIPHYYLTIDVRVDELMKIRTDFNKNLEKEKIKLSVNDFLVKAMALASLKVPEVNSSWMETFIRQYNTVDVSVAVSTPKGLLTPIVFEADRKGLVDICLEVKSLANKAREGKLQPHEFQGGTICISNLGMFQITNFSAVINPPQSAILAVGGLQQRMIPIGGKAPGEVAHFIQVTLSCDHRVIDGAVGATWLKAFRSLIESPSRMLL